MATELKLTSELRAGDRLVFADMIDVITSIDYEGCDTIASITANRFVPSDPQRVQGRSVTFYAGVNASHDVEVQS